MKWTLCVICMLMAGTSTRANAYGIDALVQCSNAQEFSQKTLSDLKVCLRSTTDEARVETLHAIQEKNYFPITYILKFKNGSSAVITLASKNTRNCVDSNNALSMKQVREGMYFGRNCFTLKSRRNTFAATQSIEVSVVYNYPENLSNGLGWLSTFRLEIDAKYCERFPDCGQPESFRIKFLLAELVNRDNDLRRNKGAP